MANKIRYGLRNVKYAIWNGTAYDTPKEWKGAVSLSLSREGGDSSDFYADDGVFYSFAATNGGYSGDLEMARIIDAVRVDLLAEIADDGTGVQYETSQGEPAEFALICEMQGDQNPIGFVFYGCKASRPEMNANTKGDSPEVDTETLNIRISGQDFEYLGEEKHFIQGHIEKTSENAAKYAAFFNAVSVPTASA